MKDDIAKRNHFIHFIEKWFIIGFILFIVIQLTSIGIINMITPKEKRVSFQSYEKVDKDYMGHWYDGTFFINMTVNENFDSYDKYEEMNKEISDDPIHKVCYFGGTICFITGLIFIVISAFKERKNKLLTGNTPLIIILSGLLFLLYKLFEETDLYLEVSLYSKYATGFLKTASYYPMIYSLILPVLLIILGLLYRQMQMKKLNKKTNNNEKVIKMISIIILIVGFVFIGYRFGARVYELIHNNSIRIPFYYNMLELPYNFAEPSSYTKLIVLRFIKDLPIFISSVISIIMFLKIILSYVKGNIVSKENKKRFRIIFIMLFISSIVFNLLGLFEVKLLNSEFLYQYKDAVYTIAIRSLTEPLLYGGFIYLFKHYVELGYINRK